MNNKSTLLIFTGAMLLSVGFPGMAPAQDTSGAGTKPPASVTFVGNIAVVSDYVFRGVSFSDEDPVAQGGIDAAWNNGAYMGVFGSGVDKPFGAVYNQIGGDEDVEIDVYVGWHSPGNDTVVFDLGAIRYGFEPDEDDLAWTEVYGSVRFHGLTLRGNQRVEGADMGSYVEASYFRAIKNLFDIKLHVGHWDLDRPLRDDDGSRDTINYSDVSIGIGKVYKGFRFELRYAGTGDHGPARYGRFADDRAVLFIGKQFRLGSR